MFITDDHRKNATDENIEGHADIHRKTCDELLCNLRGIQHADFSSWTAHLESQGDTLKRYCGHPDMAYSQIQALEWCLQMTIQDASKMITEAGQALEQLRDIRLGTGTMENLMTAKEQIEAERGIK
tara:strand:- start:17159 stop:17536 length:378 start_codon:yes stop_codon:yes gene_type:complete